MRQQQYALAETQTPGGFLQKRDKSINGFFFLILTSSFCSLFSRTHPFHLSLSPRHSLTYLIPPLRPFTHYALSLSLRLGRRRASSELKGDGSNGRQHRGEVLQLQHPSNVSPAAANGPPSPSLSPPTHTLICSIDGRARLNLGQ